MSLVLYTSSHKDSAGNFVLHILYSLLKAKRTIWIDQSFSYLTNKAFIGETHINQAIPELLLCERS